ncbi:hypothetical protein DMUE_2817 [Dictyocoela muelleri]|nr:hypothetical protein DMUE_2817 [Dictyocoela muelleri]
MLPKEFQRTLTLIKKNYKNPIIISILYNHLSSLNNTKISIIDLKDEYSQLILGSQLKHPLSVEKKIPIFIKELKNNQNINQKDEFLNSKNIINTKSNNNKYNIINESDYNKYNYNNDDNIKDDNIKDDNKIILSFKTKFKMIIILYYLILKPIKNQILIFDLMSFIGCSDFIDSLIIKLVQKNIFSQIFNPQMKNIRIKDEVVEMVIEMIIKKYIKNGNNLNEDYLKENYLNGNNLNNDFLNNDYNKILIDTLPLYIMINKKPLKMPFYKKYSLMRYLESLTFYVKYAKSTDFIKEILNNKDLIEIFKKFIEKEDLNSINVFKCDDDNNDINSQECDDDNNDINSQECDDDNNVINFSPNYDLKNFIENEDLKKLFNFLKEEYESSTDKNKFRKTLKIFLDSI